jgi:uncharacterized protein YbaR (Trm112 family)
MSEKKYTLSELKAAYDNNANVMNLLREGEGGNSSFTIQMTYDLQAGNYTKFISIPDNRQIREKTSEDLFDYFKPYLAQNVNILEAGIGEATNLAFILKQLPKDLKYTISGFDISWSRMHYARMFMRSEGFSELELFGATLSSIPLPDSSIDIVFTIHAIEANFGNEEAILQELYRVTKKVLIMFEPSYEFANEKARARMDWLGYCRGLYDIAIKNGWNVTTHELCKGINNSWNPTGVIIIEKNTEGKQREIKSYSCLMCGKELLEHDGSLFCKNCGVVFPIIRGIPMILHESAIVASKYMVENL